MVRLTAEFGAKSETHLNTFIHRSQQKLSEDSFIWKFENSLKMNLRPTLAFDLEQLSKKQRIQGYDKEEWQPEFLFALFTSRTGCTFHVTLNFVDEEDKARRRLLIGAGTDMNTKMRGRLRQQVEERINELQFDKNAISRINREIRQLKKQKRDRERLG